MKRSRWIRILMLCTVLVGLCAFTSMAASDDTAPKVLSIQMDKTKYEYGERVKFTLDIEETGTGVNDICINVARRKSATSAEGCTLARTFDTALYSGTHTFTFKVDTNTGKPLSEGSYYLDSIQIEDSAGNVRQYYGYDSGTDEDGNQFIRCESSEDICYTPGGTEFTVGNLEIDNVKVNSFRFDAETINEGESIPVSFSLSGGQEGEEYMAFLDFVRSGTIYSTETVSFDYAEDVSLLMEPQGNFGFGKWTVEAIEIKKASSKEYKVYSNLHLGDETVFAYSSDDQFLADGNSYFKVKSSSADEKYPRLLSVYISPETLTKPGFIKGKLTFDVPYSNIRQLDVMFTGKGTGTLKDQIGIKPDSKGRFSIGIGTKTPATDYYLSQIGIWDIYGNYWNIQGDSFWSEKGGFYPNLDNGKQYFVGTDENDEYITLYPEFTGARYVTVIDEFDVAFHSSLSDPQLIAKLKALQDGETGRIDINGDFTAKAAVFEAIAGKNVSVIFEKYNYQWVFKGTDITAPKDVDLHIDFSRTNGEDYTADGDALIINFPENGDLPGKANIRIKSDYTYKIYKLHHGIYLYFFNNKTDNLDLESESAITAYLDDSDSWCSFDITHNSRFLASASELKETAIPLSRGSTFKKGKYTYKVLAGRQIALTKVNSKKSLKTANIPDTVTYKGATYKVTQINDSAFSKCKKLYKVTIGRNVQKIGKKAFYNCPKLKTMTIGRNVQKIGKQAFYNCPKLKTVTIKSALLKKSEIGSKAFGKIYSKATIKVPKKVFKKYKSMLKAKGFNGKKQKVKS